MPKLERAVPEVDQSVTRAVAIPLLKEIFVDRLQLPSGIKISYPGYTDTVSQPGGLISNPNEDIRFPTSDKFSIEITETPVQDWLPSAQTKGPEHIPLFLNRDLELEIRPIYMSVEMRISMHYRSKSKTEARQFYNLMTMKLPNRQDTWLHTIKYSYGIPKSYMAILREIHRLTENVAGYGDSFDDFFQKWCSPRWGQLTDQVAKNTMDVVSESQNRCMGFFEVPAEPDWGSRTSETDVWEIEFPYVLRYEKISEIYFSYPVVIHNQILSKKYRNEEGFQRLKDQQTHRTLSMTHLKAFESMENVKRPNNDFPGHYFPSYDEFMPRMVDKKTMRIFTVLVQLAKETDPDPLLLINLKDLEADQYGLVLSDPIKKLASADAQWMNIPRESILQVSLYMGRLLMNHDWITIDSDLNVRSTKPLNPRRYYHIRFSCITDLTYLTEGAKDRLKPHPDAMANIIEYFLPEGSPQPVIKVVGGEVTDRSFDEIAEGLRGNGFGRTMRTVQHTILNGVYNMKR